MANKKRFKETGADLLFSANDAAPEFSDESASVAAGSPKDKAKENKYADILESIKQTGELPGGNVTFYLEAEIIEAVIDTSKRLNLSRSKLVNKILRQVLLAEED